MISVSVTPERLYQFKVLSFAVENSPATFQHLIYMNYNWIRYRKTYVDDAIIYSDDWDQQIKTIREFFERLNKAKFTISLAKSEFCDASLTF